LNLDIAFVKQQEHWKHYRSLPVIAEGLQKEGWCRLIGIEDPTDVGLVRQYGWDDWDLLVVSDRDDTHKLMSWDVGVWAAVPTLRLCCATGISSVAGGMNQLAQPYVACAEVANMMSVTKVQLASRYHAQLAEAHYRRIFCGSFVDEVMEKIVVLPYGIDVPELVPGRRIEEPITILFPHRVHPDKGPDEFVAYCKALRREAPNLGIDVQVRFKPHSAKWRAAEEFVSVSYGRPLSREGLFDLFRSADFVFSSALHENWGLAVMEAVACGCRPVLPDRLSYPELHPQSCLYDTPEEAAQMTLNSIGKTFDNSYSEQYLWRNLIGRWGVLAQQTYDGFYPKLNVTKATEKMLDYLEGNAVSKKELLKFMGWSSQKGWGKYRATLLHQGVPITKGPNPTFGSGVTSQSLF
jgi:hypothetical protein